MTHRWITFVWVAVPFLYSCGSGDTVPAELATQEDTVPYHWVQNDYAAALDTMGATELISSYTGEGTAVVHFEQWSPFLNAEFVDANDNPTGDLVFGHCDHIVTPPGQTDYRGWVPGGEDCKVAWVMCFAAPSWDDDPTETLEDRHQYCAGSPVSGAANQTQVYPEYHPTSVANGIATVAPGARIIAIQIQNGRSIPYKLAVEWLLHPSSDFDWYLANGYSDEEAIYYNQVFGGLSPAKYWNVVAVTVRIKPMRDSEGLLGVFSQPCSFAANPEPELGLAYDEYVLDWHTQYLENPEARFLRHWKYFDSHSQLLKDAGIMPFFNALNFLYVDSEEETFVTPNGLGFPACLESNFSVSGIPANYMEKAEGWGNHYIGTNSSPTMTDFLSPAGAGSFATPVVAASVAVLKSNNLHPDATIAEVIAYLEETELPEGPSHYSCIDTENFDSAPFPAAAHPSLDCAAEPDYTLPILHLGAAIGKALDR